MASITEPYVVANLPRVSDVSRNGKAVISTIHDSQAQFIDVGISRSMIASYILRPSPKLVWSYSLSPSTIVDSLAVYDNEESTKRFVVGLTDRKTHKLCLIESTKRVLGAVNDEEEEEEEDKIVNIKLDYKVKSVKFSNNGHYVYVLFENGNLEMYPFQITEELVPKWSNLNKSRSTAVVFSEFIDSKDGLLANNNSGKDKDGVLLTVSRVSKKLQLKLTSINLNESIEVNTTTFNDEESIFTYNSSHLYRLATKTSEIISYSLPNFKVVSQVNVKNLLNGVKKDISLVSPAPNRLLLSVESQVYLINVKYQSILDTFSIDSAKYINILQVSKVPGNSLKTSKTFGVGLIGDGSDDNDTLNILAIDVGLGNLSESLGKGISHEDGEKFHGLVDLNEKALLKKSEESTKELNEVAKILQKYRKSNDAESWEKVVVPYLKNEEWKSLKSSKPANGVSPSKEFSVFEVEKDRIIDSSFIYFLVELIFGELDNMKLDTKFVPEYSITYLLTHPLFPVVYTSQLLSILSDKPRLLRQAIVTCPNLPYEELLSQLMNENDEIFNDVLVRLGEEYSKTEITSSAVELLKKNSQFELEKIVTRCMELDNGWTIIPSLIDAGGLFGWSTKFIETLLEDVDTQISSLTISSNNLTLTSQALLINEPIWEQENKKSKKKNANGNGSEKKNNPVIERNDSRQSQQLDSILSITNGSRKNLLDDGIEISKKIPIYSVERLVL